jgi:hypothetical protein
VLVIPTTMPGAFFWKNKGFVEHARATGLADAPQHGVAYERHHSFKVDELIKSCRILVAPRLEYETVQSNPLVRKMQKTETNPDPEKYKMPKDADWALIDFPGVAISSSGIRERLREGKSVRYMVPREVNEMLIAEGYYSERGAVKTSSK